MVPISLLTAITDTRATSGAHAARQRLEIDDAVLARGTSRSAAPVLSGQRPAGIEHGMVLHGRAHEGAGPPARPAADGNAPAMARLSASVPPEVNTISPRSAPRSSAICSRASSTASRARRDSSWPPDGLPNVPPRYGSIASSASGSIGVVAAWSR